MLLDLPITDPILQFTVLVTIALVVQLTVERLHLPALTGLLLIGMLIGPEGLNILPREPVVALLGSIGLIYLMFMAGVEMDLRMVRGHTTEAVGFGVAAFALSLVPTTLVTMLIGFTWMQALVLGMLLSSHTLLAFPIIARLRLLHRQPVVTAISGTLVTDTLALLLLAVIIQLGNNGSPAGLIMPLLLLAALVAISLWILPPLSDWFFNRSAVRAVEKALFVLAVLVILAAAAEIIGTHKILGAFLAGVCLNRSLRHRDNLREHVEFVGHMLFIPFFFISTGMLLELGVFTGHPRVWLLAALLLGLVLFGKGSAAWIIGAVYRYPLHDRILMTALTIPQAAATLAVTLTARQLNLVEEETVDAVIILIFVTCLAGPLLTRWAGKRVDQYR